jgi:MFS family permease
MKAEGMKFFRLKGISGNVLIFGLVSFFTDISSEMIYPLLPLFLTTVLGAGPAFLGVIEGVAESTASLLKLASGIISDRLPRRKPLVLAGYGLSSLARPLVALAASPLFVLLVRFADRVGKGVRTSPRDALIADTTDPSVRGKAFGFHRAMDNAGAIIGPLTATFLLTWVVTDLRKVFWLAAIPGFIAVLLIALKVTDPKRKARAGNGYPGIFPKGRLRAFLIIVFLFTLGNSSDAFLLLRAGQLGVTPARIPLLWAFFNLVKMAVSTPFGSLSDRIGRRSVIIAGWVVYALAYAGFAHATSERQIWILFAFYGLFYGLTEGVEKAFVADLAPSVERGSAFGWYNSAIGFGALPASLLFGFIWQRAGAVAAFYTGASLAAVASVALLLMIRQPTARS